MECTSLRAQYDSSDCDTYSLIVDVRILWDVTGLDPLHKQKG